MNYLLFSESTNESDYGLFVEVGDGFVSVWYHGELTVITNEHFEIMMKEYNKLKTGGII